MATRVARTAVVAIAIAALVEVVAGLWDYGVWLRQPIAPSGPAAPDVALVIGDGEAWGGALGLPQPGWAARVGGLAPRWTVIDGSAPGRDSAAAVRALPRLLALHRPARVHLAVGRIDLERGLAAVAAAVPGRSAPFVWRSFWWRHLVGDAGDAAPAPWFVGDWHLDRHAVTFAADGGFRFGGALGMWSGSAGQLRLELADGGTIRAAVERDGERLVLSGDFPGGRLHFEPGPVPESSFAPVRAAISRGEFAIATFLLRAATAGRPADADGALAAAELAAAEGDAAAHARAVAALDALAAGDAPGAAEAAVWARALALPRDLGDPVALPTPGDAVAAAVLANWRTAIDVAARYGASVTLVVPAAGPLAALARQVDAPRVEVRDWTVAGVAAAVAADLR